MRTIDSVAPAISPLRAGGSIAASSEGRPCSNTGRTDRRAVRKPTLSTDGHALSGALVDWLSFTIRPEGTEAEFLHQDPDGFVRYLVDTVFPRSNLFVASVEQRGRNGYTHTSEVSTAGAVAGFIALGGNKGTVNLQLSGTGCAAVVDWYTVSTQLALRTARITRVDLAFDDYHGRYIPLDKWDAMARAGEIRAGNGPTPSWRVYEGSDSRSVYVGKKGAKELCLYEKGKKEGDPDSPWLRAEVRIWASDRVIPYAVLTQTLSYLRASYNVLCELPGDACERIKTIKRTVCAKAVAALSWARHAFGPLLHVLTNALGQERTTSLLFEDIRRASTPRRFLGINREHLNLELQAALCPF